MNESHCEVRSRQLYSTTWDRSSSMLTRDIWLPTPFYFKLSWQTIYAMANIRAIFALLYAVRYGRCSWYRLVLPLWKLIWRQIHTKFQFRHVFTVKMMHWTEWRHSIMNVCCTIACYGFVINKSWTRTIWATQQMSLKKSMVSWPASDDMESSIP